MDADQGRDQFGQLNRFAEVGIGTIEQTLYSIFHRIASGQHDDADAGMGAHSGSDAETVFSRQHHIQQDEVGFFLQQAGIQLARAGKDTHLKTQVLQAVSKFGTQIGIVLDDTDPDAAAKPGLQQACGRTWISFRSAGLAG